MRRLKCYVAYDGYNYVGWQTQSNGLAIQEVIEKVLAKISNTKVDIVSSGRTDAKVHAKNQVFHFDTDFYLSCEDWKKAMNGNLPNDIYIKSVEEVPANFHARFDVVKKRYEYLINLGEFDVFTRHLMYQCPYKLDVAYMEKCSQIFVGEHDFDSFCANSYLTHPKQRRKINKIEFEQVGQTVKISFEGKGFLRYMVRLITGTLIEAGRGRLTYDEVANMLAIKDKDVCKYNAKPWGLYLADIEYKQRDD